MYTDTKKNNKITNIDYKIIVLLLIIVLVISYFLLFKDLLKDKHIKMEEEMVLKAKDYIQNNNISTNKEIYIDLNKLNIDLDSKCSVTSGVIYDGANYIPNLVCDDYKSEIIKSNSESSEFIKLNGEDVMIIPKGIIFYDPGYVSNDIVTIAGMVGTEEGVYNIYYKTKNSNNFVIRKVIIIDDEKIRNLYPSISLNGNDVIYLVAGTNYEELGIIGTDSIDGTISNKVVVNSNIDINTPGEYNVIYVLTNSRGYSNTITRKVNVISKESNLEVDYTLSPNNLTNENVDIKLTISSDYDKIVYPDGTTGKDLIYNVSDNGTYKFSIYDIYDRVIEKEITVSNIDRTIPEGSCVATLYYNRTEVKVSMTTTREISSYEYILDSKSSSSIQSNNYVSSIVKPNIVKVKVKDSINNTNEITCSIVKKLTKEIVTDSKGKNCLDGYVCYVQYDYGNSRNYPYCSMSNLPNSCGGIGKNGCSITSASNAIAAMGIKSKSGALYNPYTVWEELYPINKNTGNCNGGCSAWSRIRDAIVNAGLSAPRDVTRLNKNASSTIIEHLKKDYPVIVWADTGAFTTGRHYMTLLGVREDGYVFLSDSANSKGTSKKYYNGKQYYVDTWVSIDDLISGNVKEFLLVGPRGMFEGK